MYGVPIDNTFIPLEFFLNVFSEFAEFRDKNCHYSKKIRTPATSCVRNQHATTAPAQHM